MKEQRKRSIAKALSWRLSATSTTILVVFVFTGELALSFGIGALEVVLKLILYYLHERAWDRTFWGRHITINEPATTKNIVSRSRQEKSYRLDYLKQLEAESIQIIREATAEFKNPVMLYSIGKDSSVLLRLAEKAFYPGKIPFPLLHIDTGFKFREMIEFRDYYTDKIGAKLLVHKNMEEAAMKMDPSQAHTDTYIYYKKTKPLLEAIKEHNFDAAFGGARRDEEKSRAKERVFSFRNKQSVWDPKGQRPELWHLYNSRLNEGESMRIFPLSNWTEADIWLYIKEENIEIVPLYYAAKRQVIIRNGVYLGLDEFVKAEEGEEVMEMMCRYRTLGCSPSTGAVPSEATSIEQIIEEVLLAKNSERENRAIDRSSDASMEEKKKQGYF